LEHWGFWSFDIVSSFGSFDKSQDRLSMRVVNPSVLFSSGCLAHLLTSEVSQMVIFVVRFMISPHDKKERQANLFRTFSE
jgi:hypothetical protein